MPNDDGCQQAGVLMLNLIDQVRGRFGRPDLPPAEVDRMVDKEPKAVRCHQAKPPSPLETIEPSRSEPSATAGVLR